MTGVQTCALPISNTPGIEFTLTLNSDAALGDRTVILIDGQNNVTTFTGGLEVLP